MRQRKYRVWDKSQKRFHTTADWGISLDGSHIIGFSSHDKWAEDRGYKIELKDHLVVQDFVGLLDKYGKEIYEGDILERKNAGYLYAVEYSEIEAAYILRDRDGDSSIYLPDFINSLEIVGNIFENPELLKS